MSKCGMIFKSPARAVWARTEKSIGEICHAWIHLPACPHARDAEIRRAVPGLAEYAGKREVHNPAQLRIGMAQGIYASSRIRRVAQCCGEGQALRDLSRSDHGITLYGGAARRSTAGQRMEGRRVEEILPGPTGAGDSEGGVDDHLRPAIPVCLR